MSLVVAISVNNEPPLALVVARRTAGGEQPDDINAYEVRHFDTRNDGMRQTVDVVEVLHRYGDGAAVLARKALEATTPASQGFLICNDADRHPTGCTCGRRL